MNGIKEIVDEQRNFFLTNKTKDVAFRKQMLTRLYQEINTHEEDICNALYMDLGKSKPEAYMAEISMINNEIKYALHNISKWSRPKRVRGTLSTFPARNYIYAEPYGVVLVLAPWNYPFNLSMSPVVGAIAAGNCVILKCSKSSVNTARIIQKIVNNTFEQKYFCCTDATVDYDEILKQKYDYIFFTGSPRVGKTVMKAASENLIPVSLELGGKSPCIVDETANLRMAAKRIAWGKFMNAGQTCVSIDYVLVKASVKQQLIQCLTNEIERAYGNAAFRDDYPNIISEYHYNRLCNLIDTEKAVIGGQRNEVRKKIAPTLLTEADFDHEIMKEEIFGPLLPIIEYEDTDKMIWEIKSREKPLACYIFTENSQSADKFIHELSYGGGCVNDTFMHITNHHLPFGGVGYSGMGQYHGKFSFETFSHKKGVVKNSTLIDVPVRYAPYDDKKMKLFKKIL